MSSPYRHSATIEQIERIIALPPDLAVGWAAQLAVTHVDVVAHNPAPDEQGSDTALRIANRLGIAISEEPVSGQQYVLAPTALGGFALWQQRTGTIRGEEPRHRRYLKVDALH